MKNNKELIDRELGGDPVEHPIHYQSYTKNVNIECLDAMRAAFGDDRVANFCVINAFKYLYRHLSKGGNTDIRKAKWYLDKYLELGGCGKEN